MRPLLICALLLMPGCGTGKVDRPETPKTAPSDSSGAANSSEGKLPVPFTGVLKFEESPVGVVAVQVNRVTYVISDSKIKRESTETTAMALTRTSGIIADLESKTVTVYACYPPAKGYHVTVSEDEFRKWASGDSSNSKLSGKVGPLTCLAGLRPEYIIRRTNQEKACTVAGFACDRLTLETLIYIIEIDHTLEIVVPRSLLLAVEPLLPPEVTGFPCRIEEKQKQASVPPSGGGQERTDLAELLDRGLDHAQRLTEKLKMKRWILKEVLPKAMTEADFSVPSGSQAVDGLPALDAKFSASGGGGHHGWD